MSLKGRLANRKRPSTTYPLRIDDDTAGREELAEARAEGDQTRIAAAHAAVQACHEQITITALAPVAMEELLAAHPPTEQQRDRKMFNPATFVPALLAACVDSDVTEEDWVDFATTGAMTTGEVTALFQAVWELNYRVPNPDLPKG